MKNNLSHQMGQNEALNDGLSEAKKDVKELVAFLISVDEDGEMDFGDYTRIVFSEKAYKELLETRKKGIQDYYFPVDNGKEEIEIPASFFHLVN